MVSKFLIYAPAHSSAADLRTKRIFERFETPIPSAIVRTKDPVAIEDPHYDGIREALRAAGARLRPVPVDHEGLDPARLPDDARMVFVTPSHQFPTGAILSFDRRLALLKWARRRNAVIVEDDYDGEFHYDGRPLESLQGLDREGRIVYIGTFSRTVFPSLRIGYLIAPASLVPAFTAAKWLSDLHSASLEQQTLAEFITSGMYERHLRRLRAYIRTLMTRSSVQRAALRLPRRCLPGFRLSSTNGPGRDRAIPLTRFTAWK